MARYFRVPFADSGDKTTLPDETATSIISYATGYSQDYQRNPATDPLARRPERNFFNQLIFDITDTLKKSVRNRHRAVYHQCHEQWFTVQLSSRRTSDTVKPDL